MYLVYLLIYNYPGLCTPFPHLHVTKCDPVTPYVTKRDILSHAKNRNRKEKKRKRNINIDLAVVASQWFRVATYNIDRTMLGELLLSSC